MKSIEKSLITKNASLERYRNYILASGENVPDALVTTQLSSFVFSSKNKVVRSMIFRESKNHITGIIVGAGAK